jgi:hypothetical protein
VRKANKILAENHKGVILTRAGRNENNIEIFLGYESIN